MPIMRVVYLYSLMICGFCLVAFAPVVHGQSNRLTVEVENGLQNTVLRQSLLREALAQKDATSADILAAANADYARMLAVLYENAYYDGRISITINGKEAADISPFEKLGQVTRAKIRIETGQPFEFKLARIAPLAKETELPEEFASKQRANAPVIQEAIDTAIDGWRETGRPLASVSEQTIIADHARATLDADFHIEPGPKAVFAPLIIVGNARMRENRIRKIAGLPVGKAFKPEDIEAAARRLRNTGVFASVVLDESKTVNADGSYDITATLSEAKLRRIGAGATLSTHDGLSLEGFWLHRNLLGGGEQLRFDASITGIGGETDGIDYALGLAISRPATLSPDTNATLSLDYERDEEPDYTLTAYGIALNFDHRFSDKRRGYLGIKYRDSDTNDVFGQREFRLLSLPMGLSYDSRENPITPTNGVYLSFDATPFYDLDRQHTGVNLGGDARAYRAINTEGSLVLAARAQIKSVIGPDLDQVPADYLFHSGGGGTVRGQDYQSLGVVRSDGEQTGGLSFVGISAEMRSKINDTIGAVAFGDYGYISPDSSPGSGGDSHAGYGVGLRLETGLGPVRIDIAAPAGTGPNIKNTNFYIGIGQAF